MRCLKTKAKMSFLLASIVLIVVTLLPGCQHGVSREVVIYTSVDQVFSEPIFNKFEEQTGIRVLPVYDVEATKTTGLVNRLIAEKARPQADVFWSGEFAQTILLKEQGVLAPYKSPNAADIPAQYRDLEGYWTGLAGRARVLLVNTELVPVADYPESIFDLLKDTWPGDKIGIAYPLFGTAATEAAALYVALGPEKARAFYQSLHDRGVRVVDGASVVRDMVASGQLMMGLVDTDDAVVEIERGEPVAMDFLDQDGMGTLVIPNTVAMIAGDSNPNEAKEFIDFLLSHDVAELLVKAGWSHIPLRSTDPQSSDIVNPHIKSMNVSLVDVYKQLETIKRDLAEIYIQ
jgi:iron(III) transport system substrate-binding protein